VPWGRTEVLPTCDGGASLQTPELLPETRVQPIASGDAIGGDEAANQVARHFGSSLEGRIGDLRVDERLVCARRDSAPFKSSP